MERKDEKKHESQGQIIKKDLSQTFLEDWNDIEEDRIYILQTKLGTFQFARKSNLVIEFLEFHILDDKKTLHLYIESYHEMRNNEAVYEIFLRHRYTIEKREFLIANFTSTEEKEDRLDLINYSISQSYPTTILGTFLAYCIDVFLDCLEIIEKNKVKDFRKIPHSKYVEVLDKVDGDFADDIKRIGEVVDSEKIWLRYE